MTVTLLDLATRYVAWFQHAFDVGNQTAAALRAIENGTPPAPSFADGRAALVLADAANESLRTGRGVQVQP